MRLFESSIIIPPNVLRQYLKGAGAVWGDFSVLGHPLRPSSIQDRDFIVPEPTVEGHNDDTNLTPKIGRTVV